MNKSGTFVCAVLCAHVMCFCTGVGYADEATSKAETEPYKEGQQVAETITIEHIMEEIQKGKSYMLILLKMGDRPRLESDQALIDSLQLEHLKHIFAERAAGRMAISGPVTAQNDTLRGICIMAGTDEDAKRFIDEDPFVQAGFLKGEVYPWMGLAGDKLP